MPSLAVLRNDVGMMLHPDGMNALTAREGEMVLVLGVQNMKTPWDMKDEDYVRLLTPHGVGWMYMKTFRENSEWVRL